MMLLSSLKLSLGSLLLVTAVACSGAPTWHDDDLATIGGRGGQAGESGRASSSGGVGGSDLSSGDGAGGAGEGGSSAAKSSAGSSAAWAGSSAGGGSNPGGSGVPSSSSPRGGTTVESSKGSVGGSTWGSGVNGAGSVAGSAAGSSAPAGGRALAGSSAAGATTAGGTSATSASTRGGSTAAGGSSTANSGTGSDFDWGTTAYNASGGASVAYQGHYTGQQCVNPACHRHKITYGGTVYQANGTTTVANVQIGIRMGTTLFTTYAGSKGNFYASITGSSWSTAQIAIRTATGTAVMPSNASASGDCNTCHNSSNRIVIP